MPEMLPTLEQVLELPELAQGRPDVLTGTDRLDSVVRWVHVSELADIGPLLRGGELILTTGIALPDNAEGLRRYVDDLADANVTGLAVELGRKFTEPPTALVQAARRRHLPLVALRREVRFVAVTEAVHTLIINAQLAQLQLSDLAHRTFTTLSLEGAQVGEILRRAAEMIGCPVVLENVAHRVLAHDTGGHDQADLLSDWENRSRRVNNTGATTVGGAEQWLIAPVGARGQVWGRLVALPAGEPSAQQAMVLERAATAIALNRLVERDEQGLERQAHRNLLADIVNHAYASDRDMHARTQAVGVPTARRALVPVAVRVVAEPAPDAVVRQAREREEAEAVAGAVQDARAQALVGVVHSGDVAVLVSLADATARDGVLVKTAESVRTRLARLTPTRHAVVGVGSTVTALGDVRRGFLEASQVAEAAASSRPGSKPYFELPDVRLRGLLYLLRDDPRVQAFVEREIGPLLTHDGRQGTDLVGVLRAFLEHGRNKSAAADAYHLSRPAFYHRLAAIEQVLGADLESAETCLSLHAALLALDANRDG